MVGVGEGEIAVEAADRGSGMIARKGESEYVARINASRRVRRCRIMG